jgi:hypothetical protein
MWREWALQQLGIPPHAVAVDLFARPGQAAAPLFITKGINSFQFGWAKLLQKEGEVLWANPPFMLMPKFLAKATSEPCRIAVCYPVKDDQPWWPVLQAMQTASILLPDGIGLFQGVVKKGTLPPPDWRVGVGLLDSRLSPGPPLSRYYAS